VEDLFHFLAKNWWLLFILVPWIGSVVGDVFTKAAKKAAAEERARRRQAGQGREPGAQLPQAEKRPSAEEVAAEIRRMMGMEVQEEQRSPSGSRPVVLEEEWEEPEWEEVEPEPEPAPVPEPVRSLRDRMVDREARQASEVEARRIQQATPRGGVHDRHLQTALMHKLQIREGSRYGRRRAVRALPGAHGVRTGELVDLSDPARAFVLLEVLGPPKALRDETF
jgi:hypothetical protein